VNKQHTIIIATLTAALLAGCGASSPVGTVDVARIVANWPEYQSDQNQLLGEEQAIASSKQSNAGKQKAAEAMQAKFAAITNQLTDQIKAAAGKVAADKQLKLVVTREGVGYGGTDITADVEKVMNITEKATPIPSP
jgi:Skp family chaperone for outer membrane proteins